MANICFVFIFGRRLRLCFFNDRLLPLLYTLINISSFAFTMSCMHVFASFRCAGFISVYAICVFSLMSA